MFKDILASFGLNADEYTIQVFGSGLINHTVKISGKEHAYILQQINTNVFHKPEDISANLSAIGHYLKQSAPHYLFVPPLPAINGETLIKSSSGNVYRLFMFVNGSHTVDVIVNAKQAFEAAKQFGRFTKLLKDFDTGKLKHTLVDFHNLKLRAEQLITACRDADQYKLDEAVSEIKTFHQHQNILDTYNRLIENNQIPLRVIHHDTKISNVLFDHNENGLCVIDLDTVMPGYYLSDVGDMMRTYLSPANEEETDLSKIVIREDIFMAIYQAYIAEIGEILTPTELDHFIFSGKMMIYMQGIRFLTDFLNNDSYYGANYAGHNLARAKNQFKLLSEYINAEDRFKQLMKIADKNVTSNI